MKIMPLFLYSIGYADNFVTGNSFRRQFVVWHIIIGIHYYVWWRFRTLFWNANGMA